MDRNKRYKKLVKSGRGSSSLEGVLCSVHIIAATDLVSGHSLFYCSLKKAGLSLLSAETSVVL